MLPPRLSQSPGYQKPGAPMPQPPARHLERLRTPWHQPSTPFDKLKLAEQVAAHALYLLPFVPQSRPQKFDLLFLGLLKHV
jgi:hypothetical protein